MGKIKDKLEWFGEKGKDGVETTKIAGQAIGTVVGLAIVGAALGIVGNMWGGK